MTTTTCRLHDGKSQVLSVADSATRMVVRAAAGQRETIVPVALRPGDVTVLRQ